MRKGARTDSRWSVTLTMYSRLELLSIRCDRSFGGISPGDCDNSAEGQSG